MGPGRIKLARHAGQQWKGEIASISVQNLGLFVSVGSTCKRCALQGEKEKKGRGEEESKVETSHFFLSFFKVFPFFPTPLVSTGRRGSWSSLVWGEDGRA